MHASKEELEQAYQQGKKDQKKSFRVIFAISSVLLLLIGAFVGSFAYNQVEKSKSKPSELVNEIYQYLCDEWLYKGTVEDVEQYLNNLMIAGLNSNGDPYTFYTPSYEGQGLMTSGDSSYGVEYNLTSVSINSKTHAGIKIVNLSEGNFKRAGFNIGDVIIGVKKEGENEFAYFDNVLPSDISSFISDEEGKKVEFLLVRGLNVMTLSAQEGEYAEIPLEVLYDGRTNSGHSLVIKVSTFLGDETSSYPANMMYYSVSNSIKSRGNIDNLVIDLRDNGGGYTSQAREMACLFLEKGSIVYQEGDLNNITETYYQKDDPSFSKEQVKNIKILVNSASASASELFTLALKDNGLAKVYGEQTFGKGIAQSVIPLSNGGVLRITTSKIYSPDGYSIDGVGITPDVMTNYYSYLSDLLVSHPYIEDGYRLTYNEEKAVANGLNELNYQGELESMLLKFQEDHNLDQTGVYDNMTLYAYSGEINNLYALKYNNELVELYQNEI